MEKLQKSDLELLNYLPVIISGMSAFSLILAIPSISCSWINIQDSNSIFNGIYYNILNMIGLLLLLLAILNVNLSVFLKNRGFSNLISFSFCLINGNLLIYIFSYYLYLFSIDIFLYRTSYI